MDYLGSAIKKRLKQREDMFLQRLMGMLAKMAKTDGEADAWYTICKARGMCFPHMLDHAICDIICADKKIGMPKKKSV